MNLQFKTLWMIHGPIEWPRIIIVQDYAGLLKGQPLEGGPVTAIAPGASACMTVGTTACPWLAAEVWRNNKDTNTELPKYVGVPTTSVA